MDSVIIRNEQYHKDCELLDARRKAKLSKKNTVTDDVKELQSSL
jgi:hypothetical protein